MSIPPPSHVATRFAALALASLFASTSVQASASTASPRERVSLDADWKFHLGDKWPNALRLDKAGTSSGPAAPAHFSDSTWRTLDLPHDWAVELPFDRNSDRSHGYKPVGPGFEATSIGWYRRKLHIPESDSGKRIRLSFDGVFRDATVWVNGWLVRRHESGYYPFSEDITDVVNFGGENLITVRVNATQFEGWYYEGAGIYRHVWLDKTAPLAVAPDGIFVYTRFDGNVPSDKAEIHVEAELLNTFTHDASATVRCEVLSPDGQSLLRFDAAGTIPAETQGAVKLQGKLSSPVLWSPESPKLHTLVTTVLLGDEVVDRKETTFGVRTIAFDPDKGFLLNGQPYPIYGTCNHQDHAGVGSAMPDALHAFRIKQLKKFGSNAIRSAHNPPTPELLEACDRLGMLFMNENRLLGSDSENLRKWETMIRRDRNHPSIIIWGIANEEGHVQSSKQAGKIATKMQNLLRRLDPTRPATYAAAEQDSFWGINGVIDVRGWNYNPGPWMDKYHAAHPHQPHIGTEQGSTTTTRGIYESSTERGHVAAYDEAPHQWVQSAETWWSWFAERPWLSGGFVWTGFDYRGEPTPNQWPTINSHFGILDMCGFPKDNFYYYKSWWTKETVLHLLPHWNWSGREGQELRVDALSNCREVELFLNGASLGRKTMKPNSKLTWKVAYAPGTLSAKGYDAAGKLIAETKVETTGEAAHLQLSADRTTISADGKDLSIFTVSALDAQGRLVPVAQNNIRFTIEGSGRIIGVGNGDPSCHEPDQYISQIPVRTVALDQWRWARVDGKIGGAPRPEYAADFDDSGWRILNGQNASWPPTLDGEGVSAVYRARFTLTADEAAKPGAQIHFSGCDDQGAYFLNGHFIGETKNWDDAPAYDLSKYLREGENVIAVHCDNAGGQGGLNPAVTVEIAGQPIPARWSRSLFNGLAQIIVQSTDEAGEIRLTASADGLAPATLTVNAQP